MRKSQQMQFPDKTVYVWGLGVMLDFTPVSGSLGCSFEPACELVYCSCDTFTFFWFPYWSMHFGSVCKSSMVGHFSCLHSVFHWPSPSASPQVQVFAISMESPQSWRSVHSSPSYYSFVSSDKDKSQLRNRTIHKCCPFYTPPNNLVTPNNTLFVTSWHALFQIFADSFLLNANLLLQTIYVSAGTHPWGGILKSAKILASVLRIITSVHWEGCWAAIFDSITPEVWFGGYLLMMLIGIEVKNVPLSSLFSPPPPLQIPKSQIWQLPIWTASCESSPHVAGVRALSGTSFRIGTVELFTRTIPTGCIWWELFRKGLSQYCSI